MRLRSLLVVLVVSLFGCGGSASETPWPAEPEGKTLGPAGESSPSGTSDGAPVPVRDAGAEPSVEP